jgi:hypothetical protein
MQDNADLRLEFSQSAFKHGVTEADMRWAFNTLRYDAVLEEANWTDKHLLIGFDCGANLIEILYNDIGENTVRVFHAMKCRGAFIELINRQE